MTRPDLNLLFTRDVLLAEGSVALAARRLRLRPSAMSRSLARLREATGDPLLVRAGRSLVASPRAIELRERIGHLAHEAEAALRPAHALDLGPVRATDLVVSVPERHTGDLCAGMHRFTLPLPIVPFTVSLLWHPRLEGDPAHRWLRGCVRDACARPPECVGAGSQIS